MRRLGLALSLFVLGCGSLDKSYKDFAPATPASLVPSPASPEADAIVARFYGPGGVDSATVAAAVARVSTHAGLREIAGYDAVARADKRAAFQHFIAAAADPNAVSTELYLWEAKNLARTARDHQELVSVLRALAASHPKPAVKELAAYELAREKQRVGEIDEAESLVAGLRFVDAWQVLGSFDNDQGKGFDTPYGPEQGFDLARTYAGVRVPVRFHPVATDPLSGALELDDHVWPSASSVAYAVTFVTSPTARQVDLRLTTASPVRVWLGERRVASVDKVFHAELDNVVARVNLVAGVNRVLVKIAHETGPFSLAVRFTNPDGSLARDLAFASTGTPTASPPWPRSGTEAELVSPEGDIARVADPNRRRFLEARLWAREGHVRRSAYYLTPLAHDAPDNPVVALYAASALLDTGESGKALDLYTRGAARYPDMLGFLTERARFYASRRLSEKAERDLVAVLHKAPKTRDARVALAAAHGSRGFAIDRCLDLEAVTHDFPDDASAIFDLARCKLDRGYNEASEELLRRARSLAPGDARVLSALAEAAERRLDFRAAHDILGQWKATHPGSLDAALADADAYRREGKVADAKAAFEEARALSPDAPEAYDRLAEIAYEHHDRAEAVRSWRLALERDPEEIAVAQRLAAIDPGSLPVGDRLAPKAEEIDHAIRARLGHKSHPASHKLLLLDDEVVTVNVDGSSKRIITTVSEAITTTGRDQMIQARLPSGGRVVVLEAYALTKAGERQEASSVTGGVVRFRALDVGSVTVLQFAVFAPASRFLPNEYAATWSFQGLNEEVLSSRFRVVLPKDKVLRADTRGPVIASSEVVGDSKVWSFSAKDVAPFVPEPNMGPPADELVSVWVSTLGSWDAFAKWESALLSDAWSPGADLDALAQKLTVGATSPKEKLDRLVEHAAQEIRYQQDYEDSIAGVKPHAAAVVAERGYGDCKDKAVLLIRLARAVGIDLRFALLRTTDEGRVRTEIPNQQFNHAIVYAPAQTGIPEPLFLDATTNGLDVGNLRTDDQGATSLLLDAQGRWEWKPIPYQAPELEFFNHALTVDLTDPAKAKARDHVEVRGSHAAAARSMLRTSEGAKRYYQSLSEQLFPGTTLSSGALANAEDVRHPVAVDINVDIANAVKAEDDRLRFELPPLFPLARAVGLATREHKLRLARGTEDMSMEVDLGPGAKITHLPADLSVEHPCFNLTRKAEVKGTKILVRVHYKNGCAEVAPGDYPAFRAAVQGAVAKSKDAIVWTPLGSTSPGAPKAAPPKR